MKTTKLIIKLAFVTICFVFAFTSCFDYPVDDDGNLITDRETCYMSSFNLLGTDNQSVLVTVPTYSNGMIDTINCTVNAVAKFGTNLKKVKPYCGVITDVLVSPKMGVWEDFTEPKQYVLTSGNRKIKRTYTITITLQK